MALEAQTTLLSYWLNDRVDKRARITGEFAGIRIRLWTICIQVHSSILQQCQHSNASAQQLRRLDSDGITMRGIASQPLSMAALLLRLKIAQSLGKLSLEEFKPVLTGLNAWAQSFTLSADGCFTDPGTICCVILGYVKPDDMLSQAFSLLQALCRCRADCIRESCRESASCLQMFFAVAHMAMTTLYVHDRPSRAQEMPHHQALFHVLALHMAEVVCDALSPLF